MGVELVKFFQEAYAIAGLAGRVQLAQLTKVSSADAEAQPDTPELIRCFREAIEEIRGQQWSSGPNLPVPGPPGIQEVHRQQSMKEPDLSPPEPPDLDAAALRLRELVVGSRLELDEVVRSVTASSAKALAVERSTVWICEDNLAALRCVDVYDTTRRRHAPGVVFLAKDCPNYVAAVSNERTIAARDALRDPRTRELARAYLVPNRITSMLGAPIWKQGVLRGITCNEHTGALRTWTQAEEVYCQSAASLMALALE